MWPGFYANNDARNQPSFNQQSSNCSSIQSSSVHSSNHSHPAANYATRTSPSPPDYHHPPFFSSSSIQPPAIQTSNASGRLSFDQSSVHYNDQSPGFTSRSISTNCYLDIDSGRRIKTIFFMDILKCNKE